MYKYLLGAVLALASFSTQANVNWHKLNLKNAIVEKKGNGKRVVAVITDTGCGACRVLEEEFEKVNNVTIYRFLAPMRADERETISIWCAANPNRALKNKMLYNKSPANKQCRNPMEKNIDLIYDIKGIGTPMLIKPNGDVTYALDSAEEINEWLDER